MHPVVRVVNEVNELSLAAECIIGSIKLMLAVASIVIPLLTILEVLKETSIPEKFAALLEPFISFLRLPKEAAMPMVIGVVFGITYGAGVIMQASRDGALQKRDFLLICLFFAINHGIIEDTLLFSRIGAKGWILVLFRFSFSLVFVTTLGYILDRRDRRTSREKKKPTPTR